MKIPGLYAGLNWVSNATVTVIMRAVNKALNPAHGGFAEWACELVVMAVGHEKRRKFHLSGGNRGTAYPDNLYAYFCRTFPLPCFADDISCTESR